MFKKKQNLKRGEEKKNWEKNTTKRTLNMISPDEGWTARARLVKKE